MVPDSGASLRPAPDPRDPHADVRKTGVRGQSGRLNFLFDAAKAVEVIFLAALSRGGDELGPLAIYNFGKSPIPTESRRIIRPGVTVIQSAITIPLCPGPHKPRLQLTVLVQIDRGFQHAVSEVRLVVGDLGGPVDKPVLPIRDAVDRIYARGFGFLVVRGRKPRRPVCSGKSRRNRCCLAYGIGTGKSAEVGLVSLFRHEDRDHIAGRRFWVSVQSDAVKSIYDPVK